MIRLFDIFLSAVSLVLLLPLFLVIVVILKFTGEAEIFYFQSRVGKKHEPFNLIKFATMNKNSPAMGTGSLTIKNDPRILPFGHFLRKTKINELPQLINVLIGQMSLIGPRPLTEDAFQCYPEEAQAKIILMKPGLSGIGSIYFRNEEELLDNSVNAIKYYAEFIAPAKANLEIWFTQNSNFKNYIKLIIATILVIIFPRLDILKLLFKNLPIINLR